MKQKVLISVDTEAPVGNNPIETLIYGKTRDGQEYGISYLMKLFEDHNAKGLFFVDIAEAWEYGNDRIAKVLHVIEESGHDTAVHLHPDHMFDKNRRFLWQYTYNEQYEMIAKCTDFYSKTLHKNPLSFRAGRYGANNDTIKILSKLGYQYDMSEFLGNRYCKIEPLRTCNNMVLIDKSSLMEVPVTSFKSFKCPFYSRFDKVDCSIDIREFERVMEKICESHAVDVVSFFVHSFSVLNWRKNPDKPKLNEKYNRRIIAQLNWVADSGKTEFITEADLNSIKFYNLVHRDVEGSVPDVSNDIISYWFFIKRALAVLRDRMTRNV